MWARLQAVYDTRTSAWQLLGSGLLTHVSGLVSDCGVYKGILDWCTTVFSLFCKFLLACLMTAPDTV